MKRLLFLFFFYVAATSMALAQRKSKTSFQESEQSFQVQRVGNNLLLSWQIEEADSGHWEVQASRDGLKFVTIGLVMGEHPIIKKSFQFKQSTAMLYKRFRFVRLQQIASGKHVKTSASKILTIY